ncbi:MAG: oligosaccharide flippase family protein [Ruminococcus flavefaciens]|nr:oligosaccharide flippase family protein [Ruminococcus flavefaciens]
MDKINKSLGLNVILNWIKYINSMIFPLITFAYASRVLGPEGLGQNDYAKSIISYFSLFATLGISSYGVREASKLRDNREKLGGFVIEILLINVITSIIAYIFLAGMLCTVENFNNYLILINSIAIIFNACSMEWLYSAMEDYFYITVRSFVVQIISVILMFIIVKNAKDVYLYALISVIATSGSSIFNLIYSRKYVVFQRVKIKLVKHLKPIFVFFAITLSENLYLNLDITMLGWMTDDIQVGYYSAAAKMNRIVSILVASVCGVLMSRSAYYYEKQKEKEYRELLNKGWNYLCMMMFPLFILMLFNMENVIYLFSGNSYESAIDTGKILACLILIIPTSIFICRLVYVPCGKEKYQLVGSVVGAIANICFNYLLIPRYKANGAAVGSVCSELLVTICALVIGNTCYKLKNIYKNSYQFAVAACIMVIPLKLFQDMFVMPIINMFLKSIMACVVYVVVLMLFKNVYLFEIIALIKRYLLNKKEKRID